MATDKKKTDKTATNITKEANVSLNYANNLRPTMENLDAQIKIYDRKISRGDKLTAVEQKEYDKLVADYKKTKTAYDAAIKKGNDLLATLPAGGTSTVDPINAEQKTDFQEAPAPGGVVTGGGTGSVTPDTRDYANEQVTAGAVVLSMSPPERLALAQKLNKAGYTVAVTGVYNDNLVAQYQNAIAANEMRNLNLASAKMPTLNFDTFLSTIEKENAAIGNIGAGGGNANNVKPTASISSATEAAGTINAAFQSILGRDATKAEIKELTPRLQDAEKANPTKGTTNSKGVLVYSGGIDRAQFLADIIKELPEYKTKKAAAGKTIESSLLATAQANNLNVSPNQLATWATRIQNGEDISVLQNEIRSTASLGYAEPIKKLMAAGNNLDTILDSYKTAMATTLDINPATISLNDPTLNMAISNPDGREMSMYEYKKALRQDPRWQYTNAARDEAASAVQTILKDFGFMG